MAVICSSVPKNVIVEWKREDSSRFTCAFDYEVDLLGANEQNMKSKLSKNVIKVIIYFLYI